MSRAIDVIDMFSGCGGMSAGFKHINQISDHSAPMFRHVLAIDIDEPANRSYLRNIGLTPVKADIHQLAQEPERLDTLIDGSGRRPENPLVLIGCAPCQGFSSHRNSAGPNDPRNNLFIDFAHIAARMQPDYVIVENVPEILTERYWPVVQRAREILQEVGYYTHLTAHNMAEFGVPQERFRAVLTAARTPFHGPVPTRHRDKFSTVREAIADLPPIQAGSTDPQDTMHRTAGHRASTIETIRAVPRDGGSRLAGTGPKSLQTLAERQGKSGYEDVYGRLAWDKPAITITAYSRNPASGRYVHPEQDRGLSIREAACLQSFPRDYVFEGTLDQAFRQIGNAVPPVFAAHLAISVLAHHAQGTSQPAWLAHADALGSVATGIKKPVGASFSRLIPALKAGTRCLASYSTESLATKCEDV
ncbi:DNA cytosine methyltransferase [Nocardia canadensis]|uniref:DNA cytosine methyltransferase n=1 Tax=Nocardia canadensis TaxID=3065238 RepID=UPI002930EC4C|nr:DNA cytosine methyltransferase [Nocardia canadensis]